MKILSYVNGTAWQKITTTWKKNYVAQYDAGEMQSYNGTMTDKYAYEGSDYDPPGWGQSLYKWDGDGRSEEYTDSQGDDNTYSNFADPDLQITSLPDKDVTVIGTPPGWIYHYKADGIKYAWHLENSDGTYDTEATVDANIDVELYTGGKAKVGEQVLVEADISAVKYDKPPEGPWLGTPGENLDPTTLRILGKLAGSDGKVYASVPSGSEQPFNVVAPAGHYMAIANAGKYELHIMVNDNCPLWPDHIPSYDNFSVGQYLTFEPNWTPNPPDATLVNGVGQWHFTGNYYNDETTPCPTCSSDPFINEILLANPATTAWWVSGGNPAEYTASVGMNLQFPNGQYVSIAAMGKFNMRKPKITVTTDTSSVNVVNGNTLIFGNIGVSGITFYYTVNALNGASGSLSWVQVDSNPVRLIIGTNGVVHALTEFGTGPYLDTSDPYPAKDYDALGNPIDSPQLPCYDLSTIATCSASDVFDMWLMFQPDGGHVVPLQKVHWTWDGMATNNAGTLELQSGHNTPDPTGVDTEVYPTWKSNVNDYEWIP